MSLNNFIFSNKPYYRIQRHLLFWLARFLMIFLYSYGTPFLSFLTSGETYYIDNIEECYQVGSFRVGVDMLYCYIVVYWLIPRYLLRKRYLFFSIFLTGLTLASLASIAFYTIQFYNLLDQPGLKLYHTIWYQSIHFILGGSPVVCAAFLAIKMLKTWYQKEDEKIVITSANANAELQLLKAQIHPHFLFNTLNNIYSFTLAGHSQAAVLADRLSGMMDYMSTEGEKERVPVDKEIQLILDYMSLEKVRYDERLDISVDIKGDYKNKLIAPLLMIPFAENCFKHGASLARGKQWVKLSIEVKDNRLLFDLSNSKPAITPPRNNKNGLGLMNVKKRLELIYPGQHVLRTETTDSAYQVHLEVALHEKTVFTSTGETVYPSQTFTYA